MRGTQVIAGGDAWGRGREGIRAGQKISVEVFCATLLYCDPKGAQVRFHSQSRSLKS